MNPVKYFVFACLLLPVCVFSQNTITLSDAIRIATDSSLTAFRFQNLYLASYWDYRSYLAQLKPSLTLNTTLLDYNRNFIKRYNSVLDRDEYRQQQNVYSDFNAAIRQNVPLTGGSFFIDSEIGRLQNFGADDYTQFSTIPLRIGFYQPILGYNSFKWKRKIEPLKYEKAQKEYVKSAETIALQITEYYFDLLTSQIRVTMAATDLANADTLYSIGQKRFEIASLSRADLLTLKVDALNAKNEMAAALKELNSARFAFFSYLRKKESPEIILSPPETLPDFKVEFEKALDEAKTNNPAMLDYRQQVLESASHVEQVRREGLMSSQLTASYGLNQQNSNLPYAYRNPLDQQRASIGLSVPIVDWGERRGQYNMAKSNYEAVKLYAEQAEADFQQTVMLAVSNFNTQPDVVKTSAETLEAAQQAYEITKQRFMIGKSDVNSISLALERQNQANLHYLESLRLYWKYYYTIRHLTLYDFEKNQTLVEDEGMKE